MLYLIVDSGSTDKGKLAAMLGHSARNLANSVSCTSEAKRQSRKNRLAALPKGKMKLKTTKIGFILAISALLATGFSYPAIAADNSYSIKISCIIPALPGKNMPILQEARITDTKNQVNSPVIFQKDTQEVRVIGGEKILLDVKTLYSR